MYHDFIQCRETVVPPLPPSGPQKQTLYHSSIALQEHACAWNSQSLYSNHHSLRKCCRTWICGSGAASKKSAFADNFFIDCRITSFSLSPLRTTSEEFLALSSVSRAARLSSRNFIFALPKRFGQCFFLLMMKTGVRLALSRTAASSAGLSCSRRPRRNQNTALFVACIAFPDDDAIACVTSSSSPWRTSTCVSPSTGPGALCCSV